MSSDHAVDSAGCLVEISTPLGSLDVVLYRRLAPAVVLAEVESCRAAGFVAQAVAATAARVPHLVGICATLRLCQVLAFAGALGRGVDLTFGAVRLLDATAATALGMLLHDDFCALRQGSALSQVDCDHLNDDLLGGNRMAQVALLVAGPVATFQFHKFWEANDLGRTRRQRHQRLPRTAGQSLVLG